LRILFDKNVPVGARSFLSAHEVDTVVEMGWPRPRRAWLEHLAGGATARRGDNRKCRCLYAGRLCIHRNAASAETSKKGRALSGDDEMPRAQPQFVHLSEVGVWKAIADDAGGAVEVTRPAAELTVRLMARARQSGAKRNARAGALS
jgi:hypothetical protein